MTTDQIENPWRGSGKRKAQQGASIEREAVFRKERQTSQTALLEKMAKLKALRMARDAEQQDNVAKRARSEASDNVAGGDSKLKKHRHGRD